MVQLSSNIYIFSKGITEEATREIKERFAPSKDAERSLRLYVNGPTPGEGSTFLYIGALKGKKGKVEQTLRLTLGPSEMWAYSTTAEDVQLRRRLSREVGLSNALRILSEEFPGGSAKEYISSRFMEEDVTDDDNIYRTLSAELVVKHKKLMRAHGN
jgi:intracellular multiplication protein IcmB